MSKWRTVKLGEVCTIVSGTTPKSNVKEYWNGEYNWVTPAELDDDTIYVNETQRKITQMGIKSASLKPFPAGTVILSSRAPIGKVAIAGTEMYCNQGFKNLICSNIIHNKYLFWFLKCHKDYLNSLGKGATFKEISKKIVEQISVPLPAKGKQYKIAYVLDATSDLLSLRKQRLAELNKLIQSVFYEMFDRLSRNSKGWEIKTLSEICSLITDGTHQTPTYSDSGYIFLSSKNVTSGKIDWVNTKFIPEWLHDKLYEHIKPQRNDVLLAKNGTTGVAALVDRDCVFDIYVSLALLRPKTCVDPIYFLHAINSPASKRQFNEGLKGIGVPNLHLSVIKGVKILVPPLFLQTRFAAVVQKIEEQKAIVQRSIDETQSLFDSLMSTYFDD